MIDKPGIYDLDAATYHADPCPLPSLNSGTAKVLISQTPRHAWYQHPRLNPAYAEDDDYKFDFGTAAHAALLGAAKIAVIPFADYRTKDAQRMRDAARERGVVPILESQWDRVKAATESVLADLRHHEASSAIASGKPEQTLIWKEGETWCRCKLDWLPKLRGGQANSAVDFYDLKTTTDANPETFERPIFNLGYDVQCAFYRRGIRAVLNVGNPRFRFVVVETKPPHGVSVCQLSPSALDLAERKVEEALALWATCMKSGLWPGYPPYVAHIDAPAWHQMKYEERQIRRETIGDTTILGAG